MNKRSPLTRIIGGILLVSGTTVGAAMLAFPVTTGPAGLYPSLLLFFFCWLYLTYTALLFVEAILWEQKDVNIISLAKLTLGKAGVAATWAIYLFLLYALLTAYIAGSGPIISDGLQELFGITLPQWISMPLLLSVFAYAVYCGTHAVDYLNRIMMAGFAVTFLLLIAFTLPHIDSTAFNRASFPPLLVSLPIIITAFGFHIVIPSLTTYLERDKKSILWVIAIGSAIPLAMYILWEVATLGAIPLYGPYGLMAAYDSDGNVVHLLAHHLQNPYVTVVATVFSFCAILTSFIGVALSLSHFLADGLKIKEEGFGEIIVCLITFVPPALIAWTNPRAFLSALEYAGAFGVVSLLGLLPALIVWRGRYTYRFTSSFRAPGGKLALICIITFSLAVMAITAAEKMQ